MPVWLIIVLALAGAMTLLFGGATLLTVVFPAKPSLSQQPAAPAAPGATFDRVAWDQWWQNWSGTSWGQEVTGVSLDGDTLTAATQLYPKDSNKAAALSICGALSTYWKERPVRVNDRSGNVLASAHEGESCAWRR